MHLNRKQEALLRRSISGHKTADLWIYDAFAENSTPGFSSDDYIGFFLFTNEYFSTETYPEIRKVIGDPERLY